MTRRVWWLPLVCIAVVAALDALLLGSPSDGVKTWAGLGLGVLLPGWLLVETLSAHDDAPPWPVRLLYGVGAGYALFVVALLGLSYLPGGLTFRQLFVTLHGINAGLAVAATVVLCTRRASGAPGVRWRVRWDAATFALLALLAGTAYLRFTHLGYAELHGDETLVALRAADVIQGYERALFVHKKGPAEILIGAGVYVLTGKLTEFAAHLPFALASFAGVAAIYALGRRWFAPLGGNPLGRDPSGDLGAVAGWWAAAMVAVDGYLMAFGRMLQYQSVVFLMVALTVLAMQDALEHPPRARPNLLLAALFAATGLLAHYEGALAAVPAMWLLVCLWRASAAPGRVLRQLAWPLVVGAGLLLAFYVPFVRDPEFFADTFAYVFDHRLAGTVEPEGLAIIVGRTTLYGSSYYLGSLTVLALAGLGMVYRRYLPTWAGAALGLLLAGVMAALLWDATAFFSLPFRLGLWVFVLLFAPAWLARGMSHGERAVWLWFGAALIFVLFFVRKPGTHVYVFFIPWSLVAGMVVGRAWEAVRQRWGIAAAHYALAPLLAAAVIVFGFYVHRLFVVNNPEVLRTWDENRPAGYWTGFTTPKFESIFGFPLRSGWKTVAALYADGTLQGRLDTNDRFFMTVPDWYLRGEAFCGRDEPNYYILVPHPLPVDRAARDEERSRLTDGYYQWGIVTANDTPQLEIWARKDRVAGEMADSPRRFADEAYTPLYNANLLSPFFLRNGPVGAVAIPNPTDVRFGNAIHLLGYAVDRTTVAPGGEVEVELYWRTAAPLTTNYFVSLQVLDPVTTGKAGQRDGEPGCNRVPTTRWTPGDRIFDRYVVPIAEDAVEGTYHLALIVYNDQGALPVTDASGQVNGSAVLVPITVTP